MGKLKGSLPIEGSVGNLTFSKNTSGIVVRQRTGVAQSRVQSDPAFQRTRENNTEFTALAAAGKLIRTAFRHPSFETKSIDFRSRLTKRLGKVLRSDLVSTRGNRSVSAGDLTLLKGFEFNQAALTGQQLIQQYDITADISLESLELQLASFVPDCAFDLPEGAAALKLSVIAAYVDFEAGLFSSATAVSDFIPYKHTIHDAQRISISLAPMPGKPLLVALGIESFEYVNGYPCPLDKGMHNALAIVKVIV